MGFSSHWRSKMAQSNDDMHASISEKIARPQTQAPTTLFPTNTRKTQVMDQNMLLHLVETSTCLAVNAPVDQRVDTSFYPAANAPVGQHHDITTRNKSYRTH
jgi:hypothetical protein